MISIRVVISGKVQGVGYRAWTVGTASKMALKGWVRNRSDGTVEAVFHGEEEVIHRMVEACKDGPAASHVNGITSYHYTEEFPDMGFVAKPTL